jgi:hypothetical protein
MVLNPPLSFVVRSAPFDAMVDAKAAGDRDDGNLSPALAQLARMLGRQAAHEDATAAKAAHEESEH